MDAALFALRETLIFTERADLPMQAPLVSVIMIYRRVEINLSFLCKELIPGYLEGITGEYTPPQGYFVDEAEAEKFDMQFPHKEKLKLPGQLF